MYTKNLEKRFNMRVKRLSENAILPQKAHSGDLGYDLFASEAVLLGPGATELVPTGIAIEFPEYYGGFIKDRSSVATKFDLFTVAGVIDNGYIGEIKIAIHNGGTKLHAVTPGDKIAQLVLIPTVDFGIEEVDEIISSDGREEGGFGSTNQ